MQDRVVKKAQRLVRKQILITPEQNRRLKALAAAQKVPETEVVRSGIDAAYEARLQRGDDWKQRLKLLLADGPLIDEATAAQMRRGKNARRAAWQRRTARNRKLLKDI